MSAEKLRVEILKLLLQVAWADDDIAPEEVDHILSLAEQANASEFDMELFRQCLRGDAALPAPDFALLRAHSDEVLSAAADLIASDDKVDADEAAVLRQIRELLSV
jgi:uncharacterized tellurite resistance protein B-like protein